MPPLVRAWTLAIAALASACLYDAGDRCGAHMHLGALDSCVCDDGAIALEASCAPCPPGEIVKANACVCADGQVRDPSGACVAAPSGQGVACGPAAPCLSAADSLCAEEGYCTRRCTGSADCTGGYACDLAAPAPTCVRPPSGLNAACSSQDDCAAYEADYCETTIGHVCLVSGCTLTPDDCFIGWECCDLSAFGFRVMCVPEGRCPRS